tara:strand:- start:7667 stop:9067 length:1401 start_codon:yes stop_codon:yes gene_type:complete
MVKIYNTLSRKKETLRSRSGKKLNLFVCGPTVYDFSHIGHARTYISFDAFVRYLKTLKYKVTYLQNITDIDDKIIQRAKEKGVTPKALAKQFEKEYLKDMKVLGITSVSKHARATDYIPEIIKQVQRLLDKGYAYEVQNDGLYYDVSKFKDYGKLSRRTSEQAEDAVSRIDESVKKRNKGDFAVWKFSKKGEPKWKSPWGLGRPGWHIEDTAITEKHFGQQYDIHGGARDLIFPHHEAEIAQMEAISGKKPLATYWMHPGFLTVQGEKMAKSLGNFVTVQDFLKEHSPRVLRLLVLKTHYRSPIDYSEVMLLQAERELDRIDEFVDKLKTVRSSKNSLFDIKKFKKQVHAALQDDFNTPKAIAELFHIVKRGNALLEKQSLSKKQALAILAFLKEIDAVFGFVFWGRKKQGEVPADVLKLLKQREIYRIERKWEKADELRKRIQQKGWVVDDTPTGSRLKKAPTFS